ncbi:hypothetical protein GOB93_07370 [Acetobacter musti]|uniref:Uncharacterized protein n=1 Tax=Acetobacter musti TaxID=864732 RepID=A0ABX0JN63_9PROT|nr:hypothetical protein [Acetobacter musti]NHN84464.1 hypothetical protein [Acetobacter musti]
MVLQLQSQVKQLQQQQKPAGRHAATTRTDNLPRARPRFISETPVLAQHGAPDFTGPMRIDGRAVPPYSVDMNPVPVTVAGQPLTVAGEPVAVPEINLSSSSPAFLTQTGVDTAPAVFRIGSVSVKLGGFVDMSNIFRDKNLTAGPATPWGSFPYSGNPNAHVSEYRPSAQLSRFSMLVEGKPSRDVTVEAYVEGDFGGSGSNSNGVQTNSYVPRMRQAYLAADDDSLGLHFLAGQAWSLATGYTKTLLRRHEQLPPVVDSNLIPGVTFTRVPQVRFIKDFNRKWWLGLSVEAPQATIGFDDSSLTSGGVLPAAAGESTGPHVIYNSTGSGMLDPEAHYSLDVAPDIVLKGAVDTSAGHYEVYGLARWFRTVTVAGSGYSGQVRPHVAFGGGVGGSMAVPLLSDKIQFVGDVLAGQGIGRYGPGQLPDMTFTGTGAPAPLRQINGSVGLIGHPTSNLLLYTYAGVEDARRSTYMGEDGNYYGYGSPDTNLSGCAIMLGTCNAETHTLASYTFGGWWHLLDGRYGSIMSGVQYTYVRKFAFRGTDDAGMVSRPTASGNTVFVTFRYYPFQN